MALEIDYDSLELAMNAGQVDGTFYFDRHSGQVYPVGDDEHAAARHYIRPDEIAEPALRLAWCEMWEAGRVGDAVPEGEADAVQENVDDYLGRFLIVPRMSAGEAFEDMEEFAGSLEDNHLQSLLLSALESRGPFRRFKDVLLKYPEERQLWFDFRDARLRQRVADWLREKGFGVEE